MTIKLVGSSSGSVSIAAPATTSGGANRTLTLPDINSTIDTTGRAGNILQVVNTGVTSTSSLNLTSISTWYTISSLDTTITTSGANSKILINAQIYGEADTADYVVCFKIVKVIGGTESDITNGIGDAASNRSRINQVKNIGYYDNDQSSTPSTNVFAGLLDSPSQSANTAITYRLKVMIDEGSSKVFYVNRPVTDGDEASMERGISYMTLMEVAA